MKKKYYIEPEIILLGVIGNEALMQQSPTLPVATGGEEGGESEDDVDKFEDLLSNYGSRLWEE